MPLATGIPSDSSGGHPTSLNVKICFQVSCSRASTYGTAWSLFS